MDYKQFNNQKNKSSDPHSRANNTMFPTPSMFAGSPTHYPNDRAQSSSSSTPMNRPQNPWNAPQGTPKLMKFSEKFTAALDESGGRASNQSENYWPKPNVKLPTSDVKDLPDKDNYKEKIVFLSGTIENLFKWHKQITHFCFYEVIAPFLSKQESTVNKESILILREQRGPVLQVLYYPFDYPVVPNLTSGQIVRCVGTMVGINKLKAIKIRLANDEEIESYKRIVFICNKVAIHT